MQKIPTQIEKCVKNEKGILMNFFTHMKEDL